MFNLGCGSQTRSEDVRGLRRLGKGAEGAAEHAPGGQQFQSTLIENSPTGRPLRPEPVHQ
eukprot:979185-Pyramimonas_sp.AAC.1